MTTALRAAIRAEIAAMCAYNRTTDPDFVGNEIAASVMVAGNPGTKLCLAVEATRHWKKLLCESLGDCDPETWASDPVKRKVLEAYSLACSYVRRLCKRRESDPEVNLVNSR